MTETILSCTTSLLSQSNALSRIEERIEQGVRTKLWPVLFQQSVFKHCKHSWKHGCDCDYCKRKQTITTALTVDAWYDGDPWTWERYACFSTKRHYYRAELKQLRSEALASLL